MLPGISHITAGFVAVLVGFTGSAVIVFQAAESAGATPTEISSWLGALGLGLGCTSIGLSLYYKNPVLTAWSTPGAALLITALSGVSMAEAIGAFLFSGLLITICGISGWFERVMDRIPRQIASAMLAGILFRFGLDIFVAMQSAFVLVFSMFLIYLAAKRISPRYSIVIVFTAGMLIAWLRGEFGFDLSDIAITAPVYTQPEFSLSILISVGLPLFVVTMTSQNLPGIAISRAAGYQTPVSPLLTWTGITTLVLAPFGGFAFNLAAITAAICMGDEADLDRRKRYLASASAGFFYLLMAISGSAFVALLAAFPKPLIATIAGLALLSTIANSLRSAMQGSHMEPALITFLVTVSGISFFNIGAAFWGLLAGITAQVILTTKNKSS
ncbi:MAG: benzoate membrane transport protein [Parasphingorhabdus sp.]